LEELTPELQAVICDGIRLDGISDASAGALAGVPSATLARWKAENEDFALALEAARARYETGLMRAIKDARKANGSPDWRAQAWLLLHTSSEGIIKPARSAKGSAQQATDAAQNCANRPETPKTPAHPPVDFARESAPKEPSVTPSRPLQPAAATPGSAVPAAPNATFLPETPKSHPVAA
jgi:hypothetical protein